MTPTTQELRVTFQPSGRSVFVLPGTILFEAAARAGFLIKNPCGGNGTCGKCKVRITQGAMPPTGACEKTLSADELEKGVRLSCQAKIQSDCIVEIPESSLFENTSQILTSSTGDEIQILPCVTKHHLDMPPPSDTDDRCDLKRIEDALGFSVRVPLSVLRTLPGTLRGNDFKGTAVVCCQQLIAFEPGDTTDTAYGVAFDLGTTTVVGTLLDLTNGHELGVAATMNPQISTGDDVISRIQKARDSQENLGEMHAAINKTMADLIAELTEKSGVSPSSIYEVTVAGNTTMQHIFCGISPASLGEVPFASAFHRGLLYKANQASLDIHPEACLYVFPNIGGFVGGDTVAGLLATTMYDTTDTKLLVDIGTNGEIVLGTGDRFLAASTAAGPAFEGARITNGMRATNGAIEKVVMGEEDIWYNVIGNTRPSGLCGTGLIDLTAELLRLGVIDMTGRVLPKDETPENLPDAIKNRLLERDGQVDFLIADTNETGTDSEIVLFQKDVRELQLATGAIRAGISILLKTAELTMDDLDEVLLAGAFGNFIRRSNARRIGLLPPIAKEKIRFVGNAASMGAKAVLLSSQIRDEAEKIATQAEHIDLSLDPEFQMEFGMAMMFPEDLP